MLNFRKTVMDDIIKKAIKINSEATKKIVFADDEDVVLKACSIIKKRRIATPILIGDSLKIHKSLERLGIKNLDEEYMVDYLDKHNSDRFDDFCKEYSSMMKQQDKNLPQSEVIDNMKLPQFYGSMMVSKGLADGLIAGATSRTKPYFAVFHIIRTAKGINRTSGAFLMYDKSGKVSFFADCALNINPPSDVLAEIALITAKTCKDFGFEPRVAMLSFSTRGSAKHEMVDKVRLATATVKKKNPDLVVDGEIQLDAAMVPEVSMKKCPDSVLKGNANVFIFPDLNSGNIGYKLVQRFGNYEAIGPILQGLRKPANDLSRGCSVNDVINLAAITVVQSLTNYDSAPTTPAASLDSSVLPKANIPRQDEKLIEKKTPSIDMLPKEVRKVIEDSRKK